MYIFIIGGIGLIGCYLIFVLFCDVLIKIMVLMCDVIKVKVSLFDNVVLVILLDDIFDFDDVDVVINFVGEFIVDKCWSEIQKM